MKFLNTIHEKLLTIAIMLLVSCYSIAQVNTGTPYSRFGIGELSDGNSIFGAGLSGSVTALSPFYSVNHMNPASYSSIIHPILQTGLTVKSYELANSESSHTSYLSKINEISIGLPLNKGFGVAFGIKPFSSVGYEFSDLSATLDDGTGATYFYSGDGGYTHGYLGTSYKKNVFKEIMVKNASGIVTDTIKFKDSSIAFGLNGNLIFGIANYNRDVLFDDVSNSFHRLETNSMSVGDPSLTYGVQFEKNLKTNYESYKGKSVKVSDWNLLLGASISPSNSIQVTNSTLIQRALYSSSTVEFVPVDTVFFSGDSKGEIMLPSKFAASVALSVSNKKENQFLFALEWKNQNWTKYTSSFVEEGSVNDFTNSNMYSFGFQFSPKPVGEKNLPWYKTTLYQAGVKYGDNYLNLNGSGVTEQRVSLGVSIPILGSRTLSRINLGMDFGSVGSTDNDLIKETSLNAYFGISLMPDMRRNGWFRQSKYR